MVGSMIVHAYTWAHARAHTHTCTMHARARTHTRAHRQAHHRACRCGSKQAGVTKPCTDVINAPDTTAAAMVSCTVARSVFDPPLFCTISDTRLYCIPNSALLTKPARQHLLEPRLELYGYFLRCTASATGRGGQTCYAYSGCDSSSMHARTHARTRPHVHTLKQIILI